VRALESFRHPPEHGDVIGVTKISGNDDRVAFARDAAFAAE
jgi:hypothetical protein